MRFSNILAALAFTGIASAAAISRPVRAINTVVARDDACSAEVNALNNLITASYQDLPSVIKTLESVATSLKSLSGTEASLVNNVNSIVATMKSISGSDIQELGSLLPLIPSLAGLAYNVATAAA